MRTVLRTSLAAIAALALAGLVSGQTSDKAPKEKEMKIVTVLRDGDCGSEALTRVKDVASRLGIEIAIEEIIFESEEQAKALNWPCGPTVRISELDFYSKVRVESSCAVT